LLQAPFAVQPHKEAQSFGWVLQKIIALTLPSEPDFIGGFLYPLSPLSFPRYKLIGSKRDGQPVSGEQAIRLPPVTPNHDLSDRK
jgi:hypothetical protein